MLSITIMESEYYDEVNECFINIEPQQLELEHSLASVAKWESKWNKPYISDKPKTFEEALDYIRCMTLTPNVDPSVYYGLTPADMVKIKNYIEAPMTATTFSNYENRKRGKKEIVTAEILYNSMILLNIPFECQYWHLSRLTTLIRVCEIRNRPSKKMKKKDILSQNAALNAARCQRLNTRG